jgi:hypothetical protein
MPIQKYKTTKGEIRYRVALCINGVRTAKVFRTKVEAAIWEEKMDTVVRSGQSTEEIVAPGDMIFNEAIDRFIIEARTTVSIGQVKNYEWAQKQLIKSFGGRVRMSAITPQNVASHVLRRTIEDQVGPSIIRLELSLIRLV